MIREQYARSRHNNCDMTNKESENARSNSESNSRESTTDHLARCTIVKDFQESG